MASNDDVAVKFPKSTGVRFSVEKAKSYEYSSGSRLNLLGTGNLLVNCLQFLNNCKTL